MRLVKVFARLTSLSLLCGLACSPIKQNLGAGSEAGSAGESSGGTTNSNVVGKGGQANGGAANGGAANGGASAGGETAIPSGTGGNAGTNTQPNNPTDCGYPQSQEPPGIPLVDATNAPQGSDCIKLGKTLTMVREEMLTNFPELIGVPTSSEREATQWYSYATNAGFAFVVAWGWGDCPAGCISNEYHYFVTDANCVAQRVGTYRYAYVSGSNCYDISGTPMWGQPTPRDPKYSCASSNAPQNISGTYSLKFTGKRLPCSGDNSSVGPVPFSGAMTMRVLQDHDLATGTVTLTGTENALLEGRSLPATFERRRLVVDYGIANNPSRCSFVSRLKLSYDAEGFVPSTLQFDEVDDPDCSSSSIACKGYLELGFCSLGEVPITVASEPVCTIGQDQTCNDEPLSTLAGTCGAGNGCRCNPRYGYNIETGKCAVPVLGPSAVCEPGFDQSCNGNLEVSAYQGRCLSNGDCWCLANQTRDPSTGKCVRPK